GRFPRQANEGLPAWLTGWSNETYALSRLLGLAIVFSAHSGKPGEAMMWCHAAINCARSNVYYQSYSSSTTIDGLERVMALSQPARLLGFLNEFVEAAKLPDHLQEATFTKIESRLPGLRSRQELMHFFLRSLSNRHQIRFQMARIRCAVVALACERYRIAHGK